MVALVKPELMSAAVVRHVLKRMFSTSWNYIVGHVWIWWKLTKFRQSSQAHREKNTSKWLGITVNAQRKFIESEREMWRVCVFMFENQISINWRGASHVPILLASRSKCHLLDVNCINVQRPAAQGLFWFVLTVTLHLLGNKRTRALTARGEIILRI